MPVEYSKLLSALDTAIKHGAENRTNDVVLTMTGAAPKRFREFAESNKAVWEVESRA
jgi:festuclavine dehydrogenase